MNLNLIAYFIYFLLTAIIIVIVGRILFKNGNVFVAELIPGHSEVCLKVNQVMLLGYYLLNIGYLAITILGWESIHTVPRLIEIITTKMSVIICIISVMHYVNILIIIKYIHKLINQ